MGLDSFFGKLIIGLFVLGIVVEILLSLPSFIKSCLESNEKKKHEQDAKVYKDNYGCNENYKTKWRENEQYAKLLCSCISIVNETVKSCRRKVLYESDSVKPDVIYMVFYGKKIYYDKYAPDSDSLFELRPSALVQSFEEYNVTGEQIRALFCSLKEDLSKQFSNLIFEYNPMDSDFLYLKMDFTNCYEFKQREDIF